MKLFIMDLFNTHTFISMLLIILICWILCNIMITIDGVICLFTKNYCLYDRTVRREYNDIYGILFQFGFVVNMLPGYMLYKLIYHIIDKVFIKLHLDKSKD